MSPEVDSIIRYRVDRITLFSEMPSKDELLSDLKAILEANEQSECDRDHESEYTHAECYSVESYRELEEKLAKKGQTKARQKLLDRIERLETELSDAKADISVYRGRIERGVVSAKLADLFIFTPEDARAHFKCIPGGAA